MKKAKDIALKKISELPNDVSFGKILQELIHLQHTELLAIEEWVPTPKQSLEIEHMCKTFSKPELIVVAEECGLDLSKIGDGHKILIASSLMKKGLSYEDVKRIHKYKKKLDS